MSLDDRIYELSRDNRQLRLQLERIESQLARIHSVVFFIWLLLLVLIPIAAVALA